MCFKNHAGLWRYCVKYYLVVLQQWFEVIEAYTILLVCIWADLSTIYLFNRGWPGSFLLNKRIGRWIPATESSLSVIWVIWEDLQLNIKSYEWRDCLLIWVLMFGGFSPVRFHLIKVFYYNRFRMANLSKRNISFEKKIKCLKKKHCVQLFLLLKPDIGKTAKCWILTRTGNQG